jgi:lysozyme family protein
MGARMADSVVALLESLLAREGGYVDHADDRGGPTNFGITQDVARAAGWTGTMRSLPRDLAFSIYRQRYWIEPGFDVVVRESPRIAAELFDTGVNMGTGVAIGFLQRSLNVLNRQGRDWPDMPVDRVIGPVTLAALSRFGAMRGARGETVLLKALNALQGVRYIELAEACSANESFLFGWLAGRVA